MTRRLVVQLVNESGESLQREGHAVSEGALASAPPPEAIEPGQRRTWTLEGDGDLEGHASYTLAKSGALFEAVYADRKEGQSGFNQRLWPKEKRNTPGGWTAARTSGAASDRVEVTYTVKPPGEALPKPSADGVDVVGAPGATSHVSLPVGGRAAMIVPAGNAAALRRKALAWVNANAGSGDPTTIPEQNTLWGEQWQGLKPDPRRKLYFLEADDTFDAFVDRAMEAAGWVGSGGEVLLLVGHGGATSVNDRTADLYTAVDAVPESGGFSQHRHRLTSDVFHVDDHEYDEAAGSFTAKPGAQAWKFVEAPKVVHHKRERLGELAEAFAEHKVQLFTVLACRAGAADAGTNRAMGSRTGAGMFPVFGSSLARMLGVTVRLYEGWVAVAERSFTDWKPPVLDAKWMSVLEQIWVTPSHDNPMRGTPGEKSDPMDPSFFEVPTTLQALWDRSGARL